ncbi:pyridine nucleotide-disulfide oxidoreductase [Achlya hypogyna]|uniref:Pyridine nucleotide-disulfide oxidoreductase n=1 Tax=Achlya hypogyna TaxID=1202772 RepID=A0A1V9ZKM1_ACHHY|nr:pyridine nucleotide-disulfide oxidoreductase [Achlya hypogyna]
MASPKRIVIVGGGYAGVHCAQALEKRVSGTVGHITLVEVNEFTYHVIGAPRALVDKSYLPLLTIPIARAFRTVEIVRGYAETIEGNELVVRKVEPMTHSVTHDSTRVPFDILVLATGSSYASPIKIPNGVAAATSRQDVDKMVTTAFNEIKAADSVLIVGGGAVGCEIAGEISSAYPGKKVTLLDGGSEIVQHTNLKPSFRRKLMKALTARGVKVLLGERLPNRLEASTYEKNKTLTTTSGTSIVSDVQLVCTGSSPNGQLIRTLDPTLTEPRGIKVKPNLNLDDPRFPNIYVIGDASNHPSPKLAYIAGLQAKHLAKQLARHLKRGTDLAPFRTPSGPAGLLLPVGPTGGVAQLPLMGGLIAGDCLVRPIKAKDYFAGKTWVDWKAT